MKTDDPKTPDEIEQLVASRGLIAAAMELRRADRKDETLIAALARGASRRNPLISEADATSLDAVSGVRFFDIQILLCEVIPHLEVPPTEVMGLVHTLVEKGGDDLAAKQPNAAFRKWCAAEPARADEVIAFARAGDREALRHLVFALEAKGDAEEAFRSAEAEGDEQIAGILALSRMTLGRDNAERAITLFLNMVQARAPRDAVGPLKAALDVAKKDPELNGGRFADALRKLSDSEDPHVVHLMATALHQHLDHMSPGEIDICLDGIVAVDPSNLGTIQEIDWALHRMWGTHPVKAGRAAGQLIARTKGRVSARSLDGFFKAVEMGDPRAFARMATAWLLEGDYYTCSALAFCLSEINRTKPCVEIGPDDLPVTSEEQVFVCRKAVGFLFTSPMTAASWIVAVLRGGHPDAARSVADLLFDPLLLSYGGPLKNWLEETARVDQPGSAAIQDAIKRVQTVLDGFEAARELVELEPSEIQRALVQFQEAEEEARTRERAQERSIFAGIVTTQNLLYGDRASYRVQDGDGARQSRTTHMAQLTVSSELPKGIFFDPVGLDWMLETFRHERWGDS